MPFQNYFLEWNRYARKTQDNEMRSKKTWRRGTDADKSSVTPDAVGLRGEDYWLARNEARPIRRHGRTDDWRASRDPLCRGTYCRTAFPLAKPEGHIAAALTTRPNIWRPRPGEAQARAARQVRVGPLSRARRRAHGRDEGRAVHESWGQAGRLGEGVIGL